MVQVMENETNLVKFFGDNPFVRILDALIDNIGEDYSKKEIQELAGISKAAFFKHWPKLEELGLVRVTRSFGKTKLYTLNMKSRLLKDILKFETRMIEETSPKEQMAVA
jgi:DNA-binding transcriptional ArsR family regulator